MDGYLVKSEKEGEGTVMDANATLQQMLANSGVLMSQLQLLSSAQDNSSGGAAASLPWMVSPYQMVVLPQSLLAAQNISQTQDGQLVLTQSASGNEGQAAKTEHSSTFDQAVAALFQKQEKNSSGLASSAVALHPSALSHIMKEDGRDSGEPNQKMPKLDADHGIKPPKKPLTPYMTFSKMVWPHVKATHPHLSSVVEIGAVVGSMWRDLDPVEKQNYVDQFTREKMVYDEELHVYLKTTGLQASDLIKPKVKKKDPRDRSSAAAAAAQINRQATPLKTATTMAANGGSSGLTVAGQQLVQTLMGLQSPATGATNQSIQQLLAQMGLSGQAVYANSDGTISVDGSMLTIQGQPVHLAGQTAGFSDQNQFLTTSATTTSESSVDGARSLAWHQPSTSSTSAQQDGNAPGVVVYQLPTNGTAAASADGVLSAATSDGGQQSAGQVYFSVDQYGQLVRHETRSATTATASSSAEENRLQLEVLNLQNALEEKTREADTLRAQLTEVYAVIERYKNDAGAGGAGSGNGENDEQFNQSAGSVKDENQTVGDEAPSVTSS